MLLMESSEIENLVMEAGAACVPCVPDPVAKF